MSDQHKDTYSGILERLDSALQGLERLKDREGISRDYLDLQTNLIRLRKKTVARIANTRRIFKHLSDELISEELQNPDLDAPIAEAVALTLEESSSFLDQGEFPQNVETSIETLVQTDPLASGKIGEWISAVLTPSPKDISRIASELSVEAEVLQFLGRELLKPFFHLLALHHFTDDMRDKWNQGRCPMCNGFPQFARLDRDVGARWLWCDLCDVEWKFERLTCPFCGNTEVEKARYFTVSDDDPMRVSVCDNCQSYIKTYDERKENIDAQVLVEDIGSLTLDLIASREGFVHPNLAMSFT